MSLGHIAFPMSPRNSPIVTAHLLEKVEVAHVFVSGDPMMQTLVKGANALLVGKGLRAVKMLPMINAMGLATNAFGEALETGINEIADTDVTVILHSSGRRSRQCLCYGLSQLSF